MWYTFRGGLPCLVCIMRKKKVPPPCSTLCMQSHLKKKREILMQSHSNEKRHALLQTPAPLVWRGVALSVRVGGQCYPPYLVAWAEAVLLLAADGLSSQTTPVSGVLGIQACCSTPALLSHQLLPRQLLLLLLSLIPAIFSVLTLMFKNGFLDPQILICKIVPATTEAKKLGH